MVRLEYPPGLAAPVHNHPVAATGIVLEGEVHSQWEGSDELEVYKAGDSFIDLGKTMHIKSENASKTEKLVMVVNYVIKVDEANVKLAS